MKLSLILDLDSQYKDLQEKVPYVDLSGLSGVNGYCSDEAAECFRQEIRAVDTADVPEQAEAPDSPFPMARRKPYSGIHLFGSGNYHYISKFFLETIPEPFNLLLIDNHPDMEAPAFPLLSCGSWVLDSLRDLPNLQQVCMVGARPYLLGECMRSEGAPFADRVTLLQTDPKPLQSKESASSARAAKKLSAVSAIPNDLPLYISIDKDALSTEYAVTDWDQGDMTLKELEGLLTAVRSHKLLGADICGDSRTESDRDRECNRRTTMEILNILS